MFAFDRIGLALLTVGASSVPAAAADAERVRLLVEEAALLSIGPPTGAGVSPWVPLALALLAGMVVASLVAGLLARRRRGGSPPRDRDDWREVTYRYRSSDPMRLRHDTLRRLSGVLGDLEEIGTDLRSGQRDVPDETPPKPVKFRRRPPLASRDEAPPESAVPSTRARHDRRERVRSLLWGRHEPQRRPPVTTESDRIHPAPRDDDDRKAIRRERARLNLQLDVVRSHGSPS